MILQSVAKGPTSSPAQPKKELVVKPELDTIADRFNVSRSVGDYVSSTLLGAAKESIATVAQSPILAGSIIKNLWKAETIGPNLKVIGTLAAVPGAALSLVGGPFYGAYKGISAVHDSHRKADREGAVLTNKATGDYAASVFNKPENNEARTMTGGFIKDLKEFGNRKLGEGEKPTDVPLLSPLFAVAGSAVSGTIGGVAGLVIGLTAGSITMVKEMGGAFTDENKSVGARIEKFVASPLNLVVGPALGWKGLKEGVVRGASDGWEHGPVRPVVDSIKIAVGPGANVIKEAWNK